MNYYLKLTLKSPSIIGSGEGFGAIIDCDVIFDEVGIPYIPARRIKGCLLDSLLEVEEMFKLSEVKNIKLPVYQIFGKGGGKTKSSVYFSNFYIKDYLNVKKWLLYYSKSNKYTGIISKESVLETFTEIRQQTSINADKGVADDHTLRTFRIINADNEFYGELFIEDDNEMILYSIMLACMNFRHMGTRRNRGFGEVHCSLFKGNKEILFSEKLEEICTS